MRWVSSKESVAKGEVSVLAIVETLCAIALVFYLSSHFNTLRWLAIAMCVSPLLLLRTEESTRLGIEWLDRWLDTMFEVHERFSAFFRRFWVRSCVGVLFTACFVPIALIEICLLICTWIAAPLVVRAWAIIAVIVHEPLSMLNSIPRNWSRVTLATDTFLAPEVVPEHPKHTLKSVVTNLTRASHGFDRVYESLFSVPVFFVIWFLPSLIYRWSLKATSIIYAPLVFVAHSTFSEGKDLRTKLELIKRGDLSRIRVLYGIAAIAAFLVKLVLMAKWNGFAAWWNGNPITEFLAVYVAPSEIPKWQVAELANSALAIGSMFFARHALLRYDVGHPFPDTPVKRILGFVSGLRWVLALYAIVCTGYITMRAARHWHLPALGEKWIPWQ